MTFTLLDGCCGAGGAADGYARAGMVVLGVDNEPQPNYPYPMWQTDILEALADDDYVAQFDGFHFSPPCQRYSMLSHSWNGNAESHPDLIAPIREWCQAQDKPWVIENVVGAPLENPTRLCGTMFPGLRVLRHRLFESNFPIPEPPHGRHPYVHTLDKRKPQYGKTDEWSDYVMVNGGGNSSVAAALDAMGFPPERAMTKHDLNEAIPPAYTEHVGRAMLHHVALEG